MSYYPNQPPPPAPPGYAPYYASLGRAGYSPAPYTQQHAAQQAALYAQQLQQLAAAYGQYAAAYQSPYAYTPGAYAPGTTVPQAGTTRQAAAQQQVAGQQAPSAYPGAPPGYGQPPGLVAPVAAGLVGAGLGAAVAGGVAAYGGGGHYTHPMAPGVNVDEFGLPVVAGDMALQYGQTFKVEEKVLSATRDSFVVRDETGAQVYKVDGSFTIHERKAIKDMHGVTLLKLKEARLKMRDKLTIFNPNDVAVMTMQKTSAIQIGTKRVYGFVGGSPKVAPDIIVTGNHNNTYFRIVNAQQTEIGIIRRKRYSLKNMLTDQDTYEVTVLGGSPALVCFMAVVLDEIYED